MKRLYSGEKTRKFSARGKKLLGIAAVAGIVVLVAVFTGKRSGLKERVAQWFDFEVKTDRTGNVLEQVRSVAEFTTVCFYDEFVLNYVKENTLSKSDVNKFFKENLNADIVPKDRLVLICKGRLRAGFDLSKVGVEDVRVSGDTLCVMLPKAEYFDVVLNPSDFEYFERTGSWSHRQDTQVKMQAEKHLLRDAQRKGILVKAECIGLRRLETLFKGLGFSVVKLEVK